ncbi:unnamed protein product [Cutaneotrichosporon oleaginosum]
MRDLHASIIWMYQLDVAPPMQILPVTALWDWGYSERSMLPTLDNRNNAWTQNSHTNAVSTQHGSPPWPAGAGAGPAPTANIMAAQAHYAPSYPSTQPVGATPPIDQNTMAMMALLHANPLTVAAQPSQPTASLQPINAANPFQALTPAQMIELATAEGDVFRSANAQPTPAPVAPPPPAAPYALVPPMPAMSLSPTDHSAYPNILAHPQPSGMTSTTPAAALHAPQIIATPTVAAPPAPAPTHFQNPVVATTTAVLGPIDTAYHGHAVATPLVSRFGPAIHHAHQQ